jgi:dipeptidyl aminopeptidase/acylaminoacyl peptidase
MEGFSGCMGRFIETLQDGTCMQKMGQTDKGTMPIMRHIFRCIGFSLTLTVTITIAACVPSEPQSMILPSPSLTASPPELLQTPYPPTATETMSPTAAPTSTPIPEARSVPFDKLPPGQYVAFEKMDAPEKSMHVWYGLYLVSMDGVYQAWLASLDQGRDTGLSPDGTQLVVSLDEGLQIMGLPEHTLAPIPGGEYCYRPSWSPDGSALAADCDGGAISDIYVLYPESGERVLLTGWRDPLSYDYFVHPQWSPDGKWIAFRNAITRIDSRVPNPGEGLYLTKTDCLAHLSACKSATNGPIACYHSYSWSPDGQMLACADHASIRIFDMDGREVRTLRTDDRVSELAWSPDGKWIALTMDNLSDSLWCRSVYILSIDGKELIRLTEEPRNYHHVRFWVSIP